MSKLNDQLNNLFDSMSEDEEIELSEELGIERIDEVSPPGWGHTKGPETGGSAKAFDDARKEGRFKGSKEDMFAIMWAGKNKGDKTHYKEKSDPPVKKKGSIKEDHIQASADRLSKFISSEDKKVRREIDGYNSLTEEERRDRKIQILENEVSKIAMMTKAHFPGEGGDNLVSGIGQGGDGQSPGSGAVWLWDLDDVEIGTPLNGEYPAISNGAVLVFDAGDKKWIAGASGGGGAVNTAGVTLVDPITPGDFPLADLPPIPVAGLNTQQETNQYIMSALLDLDSKIEGGADDDFEIDGDLDFVASAAEQSIRAYGNTAKELTVKIGQLEDAVSTVLSFKEDIIESKVNFTVTGTNADDDNIFVVANTGGAPIINVDHDWVYFYERCIFEKTATAKTAGGNRGLSIEGVTSLNGGHSDSLFYTYYTDDVATKIDTIRYDGGIYENNDIVNKKYVDDAVSASVSGVSSVNGETGAVVLTTTDLDALNLSDGGVIAGDTTYTGDTTGEKSLQTKESVAALVGNGFTFKGTCNVTQPLDGSDNTTVSAVGGNFYINMTAGTANTEWTGIAGSTIAADQMIIYSSAESRWFAGAVEDNSTYMPKSAGTNNPFTGQVVIGAADNATELQVLAYGSHVAKQLTNEASSGKLITKDKDNTTGFVAYPSGSTEQLGSITLKGTNNTKTIRIKGGNGNSLRLQVSNDLESESNPTFTTVFSSTTTQTNLERYTEAKNGLKVLSAKTEINAGMQINNNTIPSSNVVFEIKGSTMSSTDGTGSVTTGSVLSCTKHSDGSAGTITYAGAQNYSNGIMNRSGIQKLIGEKSLALTGGTIKADGGSSDTSGNFTVRATDDNSNGRLIVKNAAGDILFKAYPTGAVDLGDDLNFKGSSNDKNFKCVGNSATKALFKFGATTDSLTKSFMISASGAHAYGWIKILDGTQENLLLKQDGSIRMTSTSAVKEIKAYGATGSKFRFFTGDVSAPSTYQLEINASAVNVMNVPLQVNTDKFVVDPTGAMNVAGRSTLKGIIMDGYTSDNAYATKGANFISADNAGTWLNITKQGGTSGNYIGFGAAQNPIADGKYRIMTVGTNADNKRTADLFVDVDDGLISATSIWNKNVASKYGVVTSLSSTYSLDGDGNALDASQYQMNAKFFFNRPIADNANGTGFELQGCTAGDPTNTSAKLLEVYHNINTAGTGDAINYYGRTDADDNLQTKSSIAADSTLAKTNATNTFTKRQTITKGLRIDDSEDNNGALSFHFAGTNGARNAYILFQGSGSNDGTTVSNYIFARDTVGSNVSTQDKYFTLQAPFGNSGTVKTTFNQPVEGPTPTADAHLATKAYVDSHSNSVSGGQSSGTFTLTFDGTGTVPSTKVTTTAHYVKTGKMVFIHFTAENLNFTGYAGGGIRMTGLPYAPDTNVGEQVGTIHSVNFKVNNYHADDGHVVVVNKDATYGNFLQILSEQVSQETTYITNTTATKIRCSINYITSD